MPGRNVDDEQWVGAEVRVVRWSLPEGHDVDARVEARGVLVELRPAAAAVWQLRERHADAARVDGGVGLDQGDPVGLCTHHAKQTTRQGGLTAELLQVR